MSKFVIKAENAFPAGILFSHSREHNDPAKTWPFTRAALRSCDPDEVVLITDAWDVFFCAGMEEIESRFREFYSPFVFAGDMVLWPDEAARFGRFPKAPTRWRYVNGGGLIGYAEEIERFYLDAWINTPRPLEIEWSNQFAANYRLLTSPERFPGKIDHQCRIFCTIGSGGLSAIEIRDGRPFNRETGEYPCLIHGQGGKAIEALGLWDLFY